MTKKKLRLVLVGVGNIAQNAHLPVLTSRDDVEVVALCDLNLERAKEACKKFNVPTAYDSFEEMLEKESFDCADICVWNGSHKNVAVETAKRGKHILCEKPMALNLDHAKAIQQAVDKAGIVFMMAVMNRFKPEYSLARQLVDAGRLGDIYYAKTAMIRRRGTPLGWFTDLTKSGGGPVIDIGIHCIDRAWFLMGCPRPTRVSAQVSHAIGNYKTKGVNRWIALDSDVTAFDTEDSAAGVIHFENGASMLFEVSWALNAPAQDYTQICGSKAGLTMDPLTLYSEESDYLTDNKITTLPLNPYELEIDHFLDCVRNNKTPIAPLEHGVMMQQILQGIYDSALQGKEVLL